MIEQSPDLVRNGNGPAPAPPDEEHPDPQDLLVEQVGEKEERKLRARRSREQSIWFGLGMFGLIGWSIAGPIILGVLLGLWLDATFPAPFSWTITLLLLGTVIGCLNAWYWASRQRDLIIRMRMGKDDERD